MKICFSFPQCDKLRCRRCGDRASWNPRCAFSSADNDWTVGRFVHRDGTGICPLDADVSKRRRNDAFGYNKAIGTAIAVSPHLVWANQVINGEV